MSGSVSVDLAAEASASRTPMLGDETESGVRVVARFRPPITYEERSDAQAFAILPGGRGVRSADARFSFELDGAFSEDTTQEEVYAQVGAPSVEDVLGGYNATVLTYGHTGSGKTYCLFGPGAVDGDLAGVAPRAAEQVFRRIGAEGADYAVHCSFVEIYCEKLRDLLNPSNAGLRIREVPLHGLVVDGLTQELASSASDVVRVLNAGHRCRAVARTRANEHSSRSHAIFFLHVHRRARDGRAPFAGKLAMVDLAGSERLSVSKSVGETLEEAKKINTSLTALGKVIDALAERRPHIPYRDSVLTRVLEESLGGNCRTTLLVAASACAQHQQMTLSSLRFATRTRKVQTRARVNYTYAPEQLLPLVGRLQRELVSCRRQLARQSSAQQLSCSLSMSPELTLDESFTASPCSSAASPSLGSRRTPASRSRLLEEGADDELMALDARPPGAEALASVAAATIRGLEAALVAQDEALEDVKSLAAQWDDPLCPSKGPLRERWQALWREVDARAMRWRLQSERHRAESLEHQLRALEQREAELHRQLDESMSTLARRSCPTGAEAGAAGSAAIAAAPAPARLALPRKAATPSRRDAEPRQRTAAEATPQRRRPAGDEEDVAETRRLQEELEQRCRQVGDFAGRLASQEVQLDALRHELAMKDAILGHLQQKPKHSADAGQEGDLWQMVHGTAQALAALLRQPSGAEPHPSSFWEAGAPETPSTTYGLAPSSPGGSSWAPHSGVQS